MITEKTLYLKYTDGHLGTITSSVWDDTDIPVPEGAEAIDEATYDALKAELDAAAAQDEADAAAADSARQKADYDAMIALGLPDEMARRLSGWQGAA